MTIQVALIHRQKTIMILVFTIETSKLMAEIYKIKNNLKPPIMDFMFERRDNAFNNRNFQEFMTERKRTVKTGLETLNYRFPQLWSILPKNLRQINSLIQFKESVMKWDCIDCPCRLCKLYLPKIWFLLHLFNDEFCNAFSI